MLENYGWGPEFQHLFEPFALQGLVPARITVQQRERYTIVSATGEIPAQLAGLFVFSAKPGDHPVAGDWVAISLRDKERVANIHHVLPRQSTFVRKAAFAHTAQVVAANVDRVFVVTSLQDDLNLRRLERTLAMAWEGGATPVIVLTKADLCPDVNARLASLTNVAAGVQVLPVSVVSGLGMAELRAMIPKGTTAVVLGSSGAGKSTLVNALCGTDWMATKAVRANDGRGRHTTTHRELVLLPGGGCILDTPGMREMGLWEVDAGLLATFADIEALATQCRFSDCKHGAEPGCAIQQAMTDGALERERWQNYLKLLAEVASAERRNHQMALSEQKRKQSRASKSLRARKYQVQE